MDEAFGVASNKQHVELRAVDERDFVDDDVKPVWQQLVDIIRSTINAMYKQNKQTRQSSRTVDDVVSQTSQIINGAEDGDNDGLEGASDFIRKETPVQELVAKNRERLIKQGVKDPSDDEVRKYMNNKVNIEHASLGKNGPLFDYSFELGNCLVKINMDHIFYKETLEGVFRDTETKVAFELYLAAFVKAVDETNAFQESQNDNLVAIWNEKLRRYINEQKNFAKN